MNKSWLFVALWVVFVTILSAMPGVSLPRFDLFSVDKLAHAFVYAAMSFLILRAVANKWGNGTLLYVLGFAWPTGYGILMEFMQYAFFPGRTYELDDMVANAIGAATACIWWFWRSRRAK